MKLLEYLLDRYTMYQVLSTVLVSYVAVAFTLSLLGLVLYPVSALVASMAVVLLTGLTVHYLARFITRAPANVWSSVITGLIIFLIFTPTSDIKGLLLLALVSAISVIGKYVVRYRNVHLANPVALAAVVVSVLGLTYASWWVGSVYLAPILMFGGLVIALKIRRVPMVVVGVLASILMAGIFSLLNGTFSSSFFVNLLLTSPLWFYITIMVTEPLSTPASYRAQLFYAAFIGFLSQIPFSIGPLFNTPELSLLVANLLVWPLSLRGRLTLTCLEVRAVANHTYEYVFRPSYLPEFLPGQYLEWALPHANPDGRGTRRYFTIASSPTRQNLKLVARMSPNGSSFKETLKQYSRGSVMHAAQLAGDFVLPEHIEEHSFLFVAGGIGITPFLSHLEYCKDTRQSVNAHVFFCNNHVEDIVYSDELKQYRHFGVETTHVLANPPSNWTGARGYLTKDLVLKTVPDVATRLVYLSGPPAMVKAYEQLFRDCGVVSKNIKTDYFPGLA